MSLLKFLSAGPTFTGLRDNGKCYRMVNPLPKFISPKNPFAQPAPKSVVSVSPAAPAKMQTGSLFAEGPQRPAAQSAPRREIKLNVPRPAQPVKVEIKHAETPAAVMAPVAVTAPPMPKPAREPRSWFGWAKKLNPLSLFSGLWGTAAASRNRAGRKHIQAELSLERVQVVRNDLRDADLEIVPGRLMGLPSAASPIIGGPARPETGGFSRMTNRIFGVEHTPV